MEEERLESPQPCSREEEQKRPHFTHTQCGVSGAVLLPLCDLKDLEAWKELPTELVTVIEEAQDIHLELLWGKEFR